MPRPKPILNIVIKARTPWVYGISLWAAYGYPYEGDSEKYLDDCFEHDFNRCNFLKDMKTEEELDKLRQFMRNKYRKMYVRLYY